MARKPPEPSKDARTERLAAALKQNLRRRKTQTRGRAVGEETSQAADRPRTDVSGKRPTDEPDR
jgi:hypothetical protein